MRVRDRIQEFYKGDSKEWCHYWNAKGMEALEITLAKTAGKYSVGDEVTMADCFLFAQASAAFNR